MFPRSRVRAEGDAAIRAVVVQGHEAVFSAGNDGPGAGTVSSPATAKNVITVGARPVSMTASITGPSSDASETASCSRYGAALNPG